MPGGKIELIVPARRGRKPKTMPKATPFVYVKQKKNGKKTTQKQSKSYKPSTGFEKNMRKYEKREKEIKIIPMLNYLNGPGSQGYLQDLPAAPLTSAGLTNGSLSAIVLQTGSDLTNMNAEMNVDAGQTIAYSLGGYQLTQGTGAQQMIGKYCKFTSSYLNINITMDPVVTASDSPGIADYTAPHQFRVIQVKARRDKMVAQGLHLNDIGEPSVGYNLFLDEQGRPKGIISECATQDPFTWFINKAHWTVLKDERFTLAIPFATYNNAAPLGIASGVSQYKSSRFKRYWLPKPSEKVKYPFGTAGVTVFEPLDFNYVVHTIILCKNKSSGERPSDHWNVQVNGATQFIDD